MMLSSEEEGGGLREVMGTAHAATKSNVKTTSAAAWHLGRQLSIQSVAVRIRVSAAGRLKKGGGSQSRSGAERLWMDCSAGRGNNNNTNFLFTKNQYKTVGRGRRAAGAGHRAAKKKPQKCNATFKRTSVLS